MSGAAFASPVRDFYMTNAIARASETMAACSALASEKKVPLAAE
jgi:NADH-quinone oxidoreductase subunit G